MVGSVLMTVKDIPVSAGNWQREWAEALAKVAQTGDPFPLTIDALASRSETPTMREALASAAKDVQRYADQVGFPRDLTHHDAKSGPRGLSHDGDIFRI